MAKYKKVLLFSALISLVALAFYYSQKTTTQDSRPSSGQSQTKVQAPEPSPTPTPPSFDKKQRSIDEAASLWVVANKQRPLNPRDYVPSSLRAPVLPTAVRAEGLLHSDAAAALEAMAADAAKASVTLNMQSGYRSYNYQASLYNGYVARDGQAATDKVSARPGHSEHQTGLAVDVGGTSRPSCNVEVCFKDTAEGRWVAENGARFGFIIRYQPGKELITGYSAEPWHLRYVGQELALEMQKQGIVTLEEFFNLPAAPDYR